MLFRSVAMIVMAAFHHFPGFSFLGSGVIIELPAKSGDVVVILILPLIDPVAGLLLGLDGREWRHLGPRTPRADAEITGASWEPLCALILCHAEQLLLCLKRKISVRAK